MKSSETLSSPAVDNIIQVHAYDAVSITETLQRFADAQEIFKSKNKPNPTTKKNEKILIDILDQFINVSRNIQSIDSGTATSMELSWPDVTVDVYNMSNHGVAFYEFSQVTDKTHLLGFSCISSTKTLGRGDLCSMQFTANSKWIYDTSSHVDGIFLTKLRALIVSPDLVEQEIAIYLTLHRDNPNDANFTNVRVQSVGINRKRYNIPSTPHSVSCPAMFGIENRSDSKAPSFCLFFRMAESTKNPTLAITVGDVNDQANVVND